MQVSSSEVLMATAEEDPPLGFLISESSCKNSALAAKSDNALLWILGILVHLLKATCLNHDDLLKDPHETAKIFKDEMYEGFLCAAKEHRLSNRQQGCAANVPNELLGLIINGDFSQRRLYLPNNTQ
jgi:hypothetical protein